MQAVTEETCEPEPVTAADDFKIDYRAAARDALIRVQRQTNFMVKKSQKPMADQFHGFPFSKFKLPDV